MVANQLKQHNLQLVVVVHAYLTLTIGLSPHVSLYLPHLQESAPA